MTWFEPVTKDNRTVLYLHGGGYFFGSAAQDRGVASRLAVTLKARVAAPDYRLAPEAPFPAALDDAVSTFTALLDAGHSNIVLVGLSSGAGLAVSLLVRLRSMGAPLPARVVLLSPMVDATGTTPSWTTNVSVDWGEPTALVRWAQLYAGALHPAAPEISAIHADLTGLPPILVANGEAELLADDAQSFVERAKRAGLRVIHHIEPDMIHAFMTFGRKDEATTRTFDRISRFVETAAP